MLIDRVEAVAFAAILQSLRDGSALQARLPSYSEPTFWSRPLSHTAIAQLAPTLTWTDILEWRAPVQYISVISEYAVAATVAAAGSGLEFRLALDGQPLPAVNLAVGVGLCRDAGWPLQRRKLFLALNQQQLFTVQARNTGPVPRTALAGIWGWSYDTINIERGAVDQGITDA